MAIDTKERLDGWLEELKGALEQGRTGGFLSVLEGMGRFHQYSARNVMLIQMQRPSATLVAGLKRWGGSWACRWRGAGTTSCTGRGRWRRWRRPSSASTGRREPS